MHRSSMRLLVLALALTAVLGQEGPQLTTPRLAERAQVDIKYIACALIAVRKLAYTLPAHACVRRARG